MRIVSRAELEAATEPQLVLEAVRSALIAHAEGATMPLEPVHLEFTDAGGDAHVKVGHLEGSATFTVKVATGFYRNSQAGLPNNHGALLVCSARTGEVLALLEDQGMVTAWRTAAAGALATDALAASGEIVLGVLGTGEQALLAAEWLRHLRPVAEVMVWGRRPEAAAALAKRIEGRTASTTELLARSDAIVSATASRSALFAAAEARAPCHFTALGADLPGKQELPCELFQEASVFADDVVQACEHGDLGHAVRAGSIEPRRVRTLGSVLASGRNRGAGEITIADLTGVGAVDASVAEMLLARVE